MKANTLCYLGAGLLLLSGCWRSAPSVDGTVLLDGDPLPEGRIRFVPVEGTPGPDAGAVIEEGKYSVTKGLTAGKYRVEIHGPKDSTRRKVRDALTPTELVPAAEESVPPQYNVKSQLVRTVEAGSNTLDFELIRGRKGR
jgi:hypothetical protein